MFNKRIISDIYFPTFLGIVANFYIGIDSLFDSILKPVAIALDVDHVSGV